MCIDMSIAEIRNRALVAASFASACELDEIYSTLITIAVRCSCEMGRSQPVASFKSRAIPQVKHLACYNLWKIQNSYQFRKIAGSKHRYYESLAIELAIILDLGESSEFEPVIRLASDAFSSLTRLAREDGVGPSIGTTPTEYSIPENLAESSVS